MFLTCDRNFPPKNVTGPHWWEVDIGSRNALLSLNKKALPELKETQIYHYMASLAFNELDITSSIVWKKFSTPAFRYSLDRFTAYLQMSIPPSNWPTGNNGYAVQPSECGKSRHLLQHETSVQPPVTSWQCAKQRAACLGYDTGTINSEMHNDLSYHS